MVFPDERQTADDVRDHYDELDLAYREIWGEHLHHGFWNTGRESAAEAAEKLTYLVSEMLELGPGMAVCDIGCGYGATGEYLAVRNEVDVTGLTLSSAQALICRARTPTKGSLVCLHRDWMENGLPDAFFHRAYAIESSEHMPDKQAFFTEARRTLRPDGRLVVCAWLARSDPGRWEIDHLLEPICREGRLASMGSREDYELLAGRAGFSPVAFEDISRNVRRTWSICARRVLQRAATDAAFRRLILSPHTKNRSFLLTIFRLMIALRTGAMRYGLFVWAKAAQ